MRYLLNMFLPVAKKLRGDQFGEAEKFYLYHQAEAERHAALAAMYKDQARRLVRELNPVVRIEGDMSAINAAFTQEPVRHPDLMPMQKP